MIKSTPSVVGTVLKLTAASGGGGARYVGTSTPCGDKGAGKQGAILGKLFGKRIAGSKKKWYPDFGGQAGPAAQSQILPTASSFTKTKKQGKNATRRVTVLNKLFMKSITDMLATGEISQEIIGKGLEISRVKVSPDFQGVNVFWIAKGDDRDDDLEALLKSSAGLIRHELSQLRLMGEVPRIQFVKDKIFANSAEVENLLKKCDFGDEYEPQNELNQIRADLGIESAMEEIKNEAIPEMRHDILGLDHRDIMLKILAKTRKSKLAWEMHEQGSLDRTQEIAKPSLEEITKKLQESASKSADFEKFLSTRKKRKSSTSRIQSEGLFEYYKQKHESQYEEDLRGKDDGDYIEEYDTKK